MIYIGRDIDNTGREECNTGRERGYTRRGEVKERGRLYGVTRCYTGRERGSTGKEKGYTLIKRVILFDFEFTPE